MSRKLAYIIYYIMSHMKAPSSNVKSRRAVLGFLRQAPVTILQIAAKTGLSVNAVRFHLESLEAEGLVQTVGTRVSTRPGKPAALYMVTPEADLSFSRAYAPVLAACVAELRGSMNTAELSRFLRRAGKRIGADSSLGTKALAARVRAASEFLNAIGGLTSVVRTRSGYRIVGRGCPLSAVVSQEPCACLAVEGLVTEIAGRRAVEKCDRTERPSCCFEIAAA